jgi:hypothetical protein
MKQTSIEWLINQIKEDQSIKAKSMGEWNTVFEQAKAMEKEQIINSYRDGRSDQQSKETRFYNRNAEYYYNEKYKSE